MIGTFLMMFVSLMSILWTLPFIFARLFKVQLYKITTQQNVVLALKKLPKRSTIVSEENQRGWIWGWPYIGFVMETSNFGQFGMISGAELYLLTTTKFYESIMSQTNVSSSTETINIQMWTRIGNFFNIHYSKRSLDVTKYRPLKNQVEAIDHIIDNFKEKNHTVVYLSGEPGSGKSTIPILLAKILKASLCIAFNPTDPGDSIDLVYNSVGPSEDNPLVIVFEEADIMITRIHEGKIEKHKHIPIQVTDKTGFNTFMDWIDRGLYPHLILVMTSNKPVEYINSLDRSYLRDGRVNLKLQIDRMKID
jgi:hypothetical protein